MSRTKAPLNPANREALPDASSLAAAADAPPRPPLRPRLLPPGPDADATDAVAAAVEHLISSRSRERHPSAIAWSRSSPALTRSNTCFLVRFVRGGMG